MFLLIPIVRGFCKLKESLLGEAKLTVFGEFPKVFDGLKNEDVLGAGRFVPV